MDKIKIIGDKIDSLEKAIQERLNYIINHKCNSLEELEKTLQKTLDLMHGKWTLQNQIYLKKYGNLDTD